MAPVYARKAEYIDLDPLGSIKKSRAPTKINSAQITSNPAILGAYEYFQTDGDKFFIIKGSVSGKIYKVNYSTGVVTDISNANVTINAAASPRFFTAGNLCIVCDGVNFPIYYQGGVTAAESFELGLTAPASAPTYVTTVVGILSGVYKYRVVFESSNGHRSNAGPELVTASLTSDKVDLQTIPVNSDLAENVTKRVIYRTASGGSVFYLLTTINDNTTTTYQDNAADTTLIERLVEEREKAPAGLLVMAEYNGMLWGFIPGTSDLRYTAMFEPESWGAFNIEPIAPGDGSGIVALGTLDDLIIYKKRSIHTFIGVPGLFRRVPRIVSAGLVARDTLIEVILINGTRVHFLLTQYGPRLFDGVNLIQIDREIETIFQGKDTRYTLTFQNLYKSFAVFDQQSRKIILCVPANGSNEPNTLMIWDMDAESWTIKPGTALGCLALRTNSLGVSHVVAGEGRSDVTNGGFLLDLGGADSYLGGDYVGEYVTSWNHLNAPNETKLLRYLEIDAIAAGNFKVYVDFYLDGSEVSSKTVELSLDQGGATWDVDLWDVGIFSYDSFLSTREGLGRMRAKFVSIGFRTDQKDTPWQILKATIEFQREPKAGERR